MLAAFTAMVFRPGVHRPLIWGSLSEIARDEITMKAIAMTLLATVLLLASHPLTPAAAAGPLECREVAPELMVFDPLSRVTTMGTCTTIENGGRVRWTNLDVIPHDPGDQRSGGACFLASSDTGTRLQPGEEFTVEFTWDASAQRVMVRAWDTDGQAVTYMNVDGTLTSQRGCASHVHEMDSDGTILVRYLSYTAPNAGGGLIRITT